MSKLLLVIIAALLVYWVLSAYHKSVSKPRRSRDAEVEDMVRCAYCGVNLPKSESLSSQAGFFCSQEHLRAYSGKK